MNAHWKRVFLLGKKNNCGNKCGRCGDSYCKNEECPAKDRGCNKCQALGHDARVCRTKQIQELSEHSQVDSLFLGSLTAPAGLLQDDKTVLHVTLSL